MGYRGRRRPLTLTMRIPTRALTLGALGSAVILPSAITGLLTLVIALWEPFAPFIVGILFDVLYWAPGAHAFPIFSMYGLAFSLCAFIVRKRLRSGIIR